MAPFSTTITIRASLPIKISTKNQKSYQKSVLPIYLIHILLRYLILSKTPVIIPHLLSVQEFDLFLGNMIHMVPASYQNVSSVCCLRQAIGMFSPLALGGIWHWLLDQIPHLFHTQHRATGTSCPLPRLPTKLPHLFGACRTRPVAPTLPPWKLVA